MFNLAREVALLRHRDDTGENWPADRWTGSDRREYYKTSLWASRRDIVLNRDKYCCQFCNSTLLLCIHHRTYERFGCESPEDLITICSVCHTRLHGFEEVT